MVRGYEADHEVPTPSMGLGQLTKENLALHNRHMQQPQQQSHQSPLCTLRQVLFNKMDGHCRRSSLLTTNSSGTRANYFIIVKKPEEKLLEAEAKAEVEAEEHWQELSPSGVVTPSQPESSRPPGVPTNPSSEPSTAAEQFPSQSSAEGPGPTSAAEPALRSMLLPTATPTAAGSPGGEGPSFAGDEELPQ